LKAIFYPCAFCNDFNAGLSVSSQLVVLGLVVGLVGCGPEGPSVKFSIEGEIDSGEADPGRPSQMPHP
jgi:hypothetical protein